MASDAPRNASADRSTEVHTHLVLILAGVLMVLLGMIFGLVFGLYPELRAHRAASWPGVPATVRSATIEESYSKDPVCWKPVIEYSYEHGGRSYTSRRYDFLDAYKCQGSHVDAIIARYPPGARVTAFVDPEDPTLAVLERRGSQAATVLIMTSATAALGLVVLVVGIRKRRS